MFLISVQLMISTPEQKPFKTSYPLAISAWLIVACKAKCSDSRMRGVLGKLPCQSRIRGEPIMDPISILENVTGFCRSMVCSWIAGSRRTSSNKHPRVLRIAVDITRDQLGQQSGFLLNERVAVNINLFLYGNFTI